MSDFVLDANVFIADLINRREANQGVRAKPYLDQVKAGTAMARIPSLMLVEICGALGREVNVSAALAGRRRLNQFSADGRLVVYPLDNTRMLSASEMAIRYGLKGSDAVYAALSDELGLDLVTFDEDSLAKPLRKGGYPRVVVPP